MKKKEQNYIDPEKINLFRIEAVESSISELENPFNLEESIDMKIAHTSAYNIKEKGFLLGLDIILNLKDRMPSDTSRFRYNFHFLIDNLEEMYSLTEENEPSFHRHFAATLAGISYSTLRGIIFEKLQNSSWGSIALPVINPDNILESWIAIE
ncbi:MAG: hypothetical protein VYB38_02095 [Bacteroidota bacterium]|nr:hypothetical protein [Bacteroidota bacterium]